MAFVHSIGTAGSPVDLTDRTKYRVDGAGGASYHREQVRQIVKSQTVDGRLISAQNILLGYQIEFDLMVVGANADAVVTNFNAIESALELGRSGTVIEYKETWLTSAGETLHVFEGELIPGDLTGMPFHRRNAHLKLLCTVP